MKIIQILMEYLNVIILSKQRYLVLFKLFVYADKVSFNAESIIEVIFLKTSFNN